MFYIRKVSLKNYHAYTSQASQGSTKSKQPFYRRPYLVRQTKLAIKDNINEYQHLDGDEESEEGNGIDDNQIEVIDHDHGHNNYDSGDDSDETNRLTYDNNLTDNMFAANRRQPQQHHHKRQQHQQLPRSTVIKTSTSSTSLKPKQAQQQLPKQSSSNTSCYNQKETNPKLKVVC